MKTTIFFIQLFAFLLTFSAQATQINSSAFRQVFYQTLVEDGVTMETEDYNRLMYLATPGMKEAEKQSDRPNLKGEQLLKEISNVYNSVKVQDLYDEAEDNIFTYNKATQDKLTQQLSKEGLFVVIVPGIFGEFIDQRAMEEVFANQNSSFSKEWAKASKNYKGLPQEHLSRISSENPTGTANIPLKNLIHAASIDKDDKSLVKVILFQTEAMSLETLGSTANRASIFKNRLNHTFKALGYTPKNIAFIGYSRGTAFALDMLAQAKKEGDAWVKNTRALISLGGVVFGSALADETYSDSQSKNYQLLNVLLKLEDDLIAGSSLIDRKKNLDAYVAFGKSYFELEQKFNTKSLDFSTVIEGLKQTQMTTDVSQGLKTAVKYYGSFGLKLGALGNEQYKSDVARFKKLLKAAAQGIKELTTEERVKWWKSHSLPLNVKYYSVSATMAPKNVNSLASSYGYNPGSADYNMLYTNWEQFLNVKTGSLMEGSPLNDSQVSVAKTQFWPEVIAKLNPKNKGLQSIPLAIVGTHHWGLALPVVNPIPTSSVEQGLLKKKNPFPRKSLLKALAITVIANK